MTDVSPDEVRVRVTVDSDTPELLKRLAGSKRQAREIVYLLRLGLQMEMMLSGKVPMVGMAGDHGSLVPSPATFTVSAPAPAPAATVSVPSGTDLEFGARFAEMTGLNADYFSAPITYQD